MKFWSECFRGRANKEERISRSEDVILGQICHTFDLHHIYTAVGASDKLLVWKTQEDKSEFVNGWRLTKGKIGNCWKKHWFFLLPPSLLPAWCSPARLIAHHHHHHHWDPTRLTRLGARWRLISWGRKKTMWDAGGIIWCMTANGRVMGSWCAGGAAGRRGRTSPADVSLLWPLASWSLLTCTFSWTLVICQSVGPGEKEFEFTFFLDWWVG